MTKNLLIKTLLFWFVFTPVAILNGTIRVYVYQPWVGELLGHQISSIVGSLVFIGIIYLFVRWNREQANFKNMFLVGLIWLILTIIFEFGFGHYVMGHSWEKLLFDYNFLAGRVWLLVLLTTLLGPVMVLKIIKVKEKP